MTKEQCVELLVMIKSCHPKFELQIYQKDNNYTEACKYWIAFLIELDYNMALIAIRKLINTSKWVPTIADIKEAYAELLLPEVVDDEKAWGLVINAIGKYGGIYAQDKAMEELPLQVREAVKWVGGIKAISMCPTESIEPLRGQFTKAMKAVNERVRKELSLGPKLSGQIDQIRLDKKEEMFELINSEPVKQITYGPVTDDKKIDYNIKQCGMLREVYARAQEGRLTNE
ncbi:replicative helicase loader/inhibitor [Niameybacter massiliensis]|uniref:Replicative helicase loader/inhibitor n=1 Tax=Holtiella tumoricola TaxID=3018743 RepID=A0AA42J0V2_9FIRM|nr:replicative helicase loader/inhibitor [Holtiella tumoricola]